MAVEPGPQFSYLSPEHHIVTTVEAGGEDGVPEIRRMEMRNPQSESLAGIEYEHEPEYQQTNITWMGSGEEGKGHIQRLLHHLYGAHPEHLINFGTTISDPATHIMNKFKELHPDRTMGDSEIDEDYARDMAEENNR